MLIRCIGWLLLGLIFLSGVTTGNAQTLYSYVDGNGIRNLTNIPPANYGPGIIVSHESPAPAETLEKPTAKSRSTVYDPIIARYAEVYGLDAHLIKSIIATESAFNPKAVSPKGAMGLMQLMPATAARLGVRNPFDPEDNIRGGAEHLRALLDTFNNDLLLSLAAYNAGENLVQRIGRIPNIRETHDYVRTVTERYGNRQTPSATQPDPPRPVTYRYLDHNGVLHISNIPPVDRIGPYQGPGYAAPTSPR